MASPPPFDLCGDLDDDDIDEPVTAVPKDRRLPIATPTPNVLNDHLLRFTRSLQRPTQNPNPSPNPPPPPPPGTVRPSLLASLFFLALQST
jgi:DNA excision repair protein ERCC-6-like